MLASACWGLTDRSYLDTVEGARLTVFHAAIPMRQLRRCMAGRAPTDAERFGGNLDMSPTQEEWHVFLLCTVGPHSQALKLTNPGQSSASSYARSRLYG